MRVCLFWLSWFILMVGSVNGSETDKLAQLMVKRIDQVNRLLGAEVGDGNVLIDPHEDSQIGYEDISIDMWVRKDDCVAVEAIARALRAVGTVLTTPHSVAKLRFMNIKTSVRDAKSKTGSFIIDWRGVATADLIRLQRTKAPLGHYLGIGQRFEEGIFHRGNKVVFASCIQKLCAPDPESACTARQQ